MIEQNLDRLNKLLSNQITNLDCNVLLSSEEKLSLSGVIQNLTAAIRHLQHALYDEDGEGWKK